MTAADIAGALGGYKSGIQWMARCPAHDDRKPSLSIREADDGKALVHCHAGCGQKQVIAALRARGLWATSDRPYGKIIHPQPRQFAHSQRNREDAERTE